MERRRKIRDFGVQDLDRIAAWQIDLKSSGALPLLKYFDSWKAINEKNVMKNMAKEETQNSKFIIFYLLISAWSLQFLYTERVPFLLKPLS